MIQRGVPLGYTQITLAGVVGIGQGLPNNAIPAGANLAVMKAEVQAVRWRDDGTPPTAAIGELLAVGDPAFEYMGNLSAIQVIQATAGAILNVSFYKTVG